MASIAKRKCYLPSMESLETLMEIQLDIDNKILSGEIDLAAIENEKLLISAQRVKDVSDWKITARKRIMMDYSRIGGVALSSYPAAYLDVFHPKDRTTCIHYPDQVVLAQYVADKLDDCMNRELDCYLRHQLVNEPIGAMILLSKDADLITLRTVDNVHYPNNIHLMRDIYRVRQYARDYADHGFKKDVVNYMSGTRPSNANGDFVMQGEGSDNGDDPATQTLFDSLEVPTNIGKDEAKEKGIIRRCADKIINMLTFGTSGSLGFMTRIKNMVSSYVWKMLVSIIDAGSFLTDKIKKTVIFVSLFGLLCVSGFLSYKVVSSVLRFMSPGMVNHINVSIGNSTPEGPFKLQAGGGMTEVGLLMSAMTFAFGALGVTDTEKVAKSMTRYVKIAAGGALVAATGRILFFCLPKAISEFFIYKCAPESVKNAHEYSAWMDQATMLIKCGMVPSVLCSRAYYERVKQCESKGREFLKNANSAETRTQIVTVYSQVLKLYTEIYPFHVTNGTRKVPYALHVGGHPGVGKSLLQSDIQQALGFSKKDVYNRQAGQQFWNGYNQNHTMVVFDEFLATADGDVMASDILSLVSPAVFKPDMASVSSPFVGVKGTTAEPKFVLTMNNHLYKTALGVSKEALHRRRNMNVWFGLNAAGRRFMKDGRLDLGAMSEDFVANKQWITVYKYSALEGTTQKPLAEWTFNEFIEKLKVDYAKHHELNEKIALGRGDIDEESPDTIMDSVLGQDQKSEVFDFSFGGISTMVRTFFGMQGRGKKRKPSASPTITPTLSLASDASSDSVSTSGSEGDFVLAHHDIGEVDESHSRCTSDTTNERIDIVFDDDTIELRPNGVSEYKVATQGDETILKRAWGVSGNQTLYDATKEILFAPFVNDKRGLSKFVLCKCGVVLPAAEKDGPTECEHCAYGLDDLSLYMRAKEIKYGVTASATLRRIQTTAYCVKNIVDMDRVSEYMNSEGVSEAVNYEIPSLTEVYLEWFKKRFMRLTQSFGLLLSIGIGAYILKKMFGKVKDSEEEDTFYEMNSGVGKGKKAEQRTRKYETRRFNQQSSDLGTKIYKIFGSTPTFTKHMNVIALCERKVLTNYHFFVFQGKLLAEGDMIGIEVNGKEYKTVFHPTRLVADEKNDLAIYDFCDLTTLPQFKNCSKQIITDEEFASYKGSNCVLLGIGSKSFTRCKLTDGVRYGDEYSSFRQPENLVYPIQTDVGDCGRPLVISGGELTGKIVGLHAGFINATGVACIVTTGFLKQAGAFVDFDVPGKDFTMQGGDGGKCNVATCDINLPHEYAPILYPNYLKYPGLPYVRREAIDFIIDQTTRHKDYVCNVYGYLKKSFTKLNRKRMLDHDLSKYEEEEMSGYVQHFYEEDEDVPDSYEFNLWLKSLKHHYENNPHHPQYWKGPVSGDYIDMPEDCLQESILDMMAARWEKNLTIEPTISDLGAIPEQYLQRYTAGDRIKVRTFLKKFEGKTNKVLFVPGLTYAWIMQKPKDILKLAQLPNCESIELVDPKCRVFIPGSSKIVRSEIGLDYESGRHIAILDKDDPRALGKDPVEEGVERILSSDITPIPQEEGQVVYEQMKSFYEDKFKEAASRTGVWRKLTFEEAVRGIPGKLKSINLATSPGWPHVLVKKKPGKKDFLYVEDNVIHWTDEFRQRVMAKVEEMEEGKSHEEHLWLGFLKDELVNQGKIDDVRTRIVYCGDVVTNVAQRMIFGSILANYHAMDFEAPIASLMNQYSQDMDSVKTYLDFIESPGYIAGDAKNFDINYNPTAQKFVYKMLGDIAKTIPGVTDTEIEYSLEKERSSRVQIGRFRFKPRCLHSSGCFFTSSVNSLVHEFYWRVVFNRFFPDLIWEEEVRAKFCGDDNIVRPSTKIWDRFNAVTYAREAASFGQVYTSDRKGEPLEAHPRKFEDITFLGAHPRLTSTGVGESWTGALKKKTIEDAVMFKKSKDSNITEVALQQIEMASQWEETYYNDLKGKLIGLLRETDNIVPRTLCYRDCHRKVKARTGRSQADNSMFFQLQEHCAEEIFFKIQSAGRNLTQLDTMEPPAVASTVSNTGKPDLGFQDKDMDLSFSQTSRVVRSQGEWTESATAGTIILAIPVPFGLLSLGSDKSLQNKPFEQYQYWRGTPRITIQVNGNRFQQGMLAAYFIPLWTDITKTRGLEQIPTFNPVFIQPKSTRDSEITIPFRFPRNMLNTRSQADLDESLGVFFVQVYSPLKNSGNQNITITVLSSFDESEFRIPGTIKMGSTYSCLREDEEGENDKPRYGLREGKFYIRGREPTAQMQGGGYSIAGTMGPKDDEGVSGNPAVSSGGVPVFPQFSGMSVVQGPEPTVSMQMHPRATTRSSHQLGSEDETSFESLCRRDNIVARFDWGSATAAQTNLYSVDLTLPLLGVGSYSSKYTFEMPPTIFDYVADHFTFWRADFVFTVQVVKTAFHTGRLQVSAAYGATRTLDFEEVANAYSTIMDFRDQEEAVMRVPYNSATEYLNVWEPAPIAPDPHQDYSLGKFQIDVLNRLTHPDTVENEVEVIVLCHLENVRFHCPRKFGVIEVLGSDNGQGPNAQMQGAGEEVVQPMVDGPIEEKPVPTTSGETDTKPAQRPCTLNVGEHFEYNPTTVEELMRRPRPLMEGISVVTGFKNLAPETSYMTVGSISFGVYGLTGMPQLFAGARGGQKYRIYTSSKDLDSIHYIPDGRNKRFCFDPKTSEADFKRGEPVNTQLTHFCEKYLIIANASDVMKLRGADWIEMNVSQLSGAGTISEGVVDSNCVVEPTKAATDMSCIRTSFAHEILMPVVTGNYIDIYVPFQNIKNFLRTSEQIWGTVVITKENVKPGEMNFKIYQSAAEDMTFGIYHGLDMRFMTYGRKHKEHTVNGREMFGFSGSQNPKGNGVENISFLGGQLQGLAEVYVDCRTTV